MTLLRFLLAEARWPIAGIVLLTIAGAATGIGALALVNRVMGGGDLDLAAFLGVFATLLVLSFLATTGARVALHAVGHRFVYRLRRRLVKRVLDTDIEQLEAVGGARLIAMLDTDLRNVTIAFVHLPELIYGALLALAALAYLASLSLPLFATTALWLGLSALAGYLLIGRIDHHIRRLREEDDRLHGDYLAVIEGRKELALNRPRARRYYEEEFDGHAETYRYHVTRADSYNGLLHNIANTLVLALIGLVFYLSIGLGWASASVAATYALTILFLRAPLVGTMAGITSLIAAQVSLGKIGALELAPHKPEFDALPEARVASRSVALRDVTYRHKSAESETGFLVGPLNLELRRGEVVFVIGGNGSGKSTLARLLTGLYRPQAGRIEIDGEPLGADDLPRFRHLFSAVFTDFQLFRRLLTGRGDEVPSEEVDLWLRRMDMARKTGHAGGRLDDLAFSQGQRKRLALILAVLEDRDFLVLDEWAADQDPQFRHFFYRTLLPDLKARGKAILAITHDDHYFDLADRVLKMDGGQLIELQDEERARVSESAVRAIGTA